MPMWSSVMERGWAGTWTLHPHVVVYPNVQLGDRVTLHAGVCVGVDGFGYTHSGEGLEQIPHVGECVIGADVEIGANSCVDRGSIGRTELAAHVKLDNLVHIAHNVTVGPRTVMAAQVAIAGSTQVGADTMWGRTVRRNGSHLRRRRSSYRRPNGPDRRRSRGKYDGGLAGSTSQGFPQGPGSSFPPRLTPPPCPCSRTSSSRP